MSKADEGEIKFSIFWLNVGSGIFSIIFGLVLLWGAFFDTLDVTPGKYGASPRHIPLLCAFIAILSGVILLVDAWKSKPTYMATDVAVATKGQPLRLLQSLILLALVPAFLELAGFYTTILTSQVLQKRLAGVRNWWVILLSVLLVAAMIYIFMHLVCRSELPEGFLI